MTTTMIIAKIFGPILIIAALAVLMNPKNLEKVMKDFTKSHGMMFLISMLRVTIGVLIVTFHNLWTTVPEILISAIGWLVLLAGTAGMVVPDQMVAFAKPLIKKKGSMTLMLLVSLVVGVVATYIGYAA